MTGTLTEEQCWTLRNAAAVMSRIADIRDRALTGDEINDLCAARGQVDKISHDAYSASEEDIRNWLVKARRGGSQKELAANLGISEQHLSDILHGKRKLSGKILNKLGYTGVTRYKLATPKKS